jgi:hypothetical protein
LDCSKITEETVKSIMDKDLIDADDIKEEFEYMRDFQIPGNSEEMIQRVIFNFLLFPSSIMIFEGASNVTKCPS